MLIDGISMPVKNPDTLPPANIAVKSSDPTETKEKPAEEKKTVDLSQAAEVAVDLQNKMRVLHNVDLTFSVHEASGKIMVTVVEEETGKIIRVIPPEELLDLAVKLEEAIGLMFDKKA